MAFGINRAELADWKKQVSQGNIAILTHYWQDDRFPGCTTVTKVGCSDPIKLTKWGEQYGLKGSWIHYSTFPHFDLFGHKQQEVLWKEKDQANIQRFGL